MIYKGEMNLMISNSGFFINDEWVTSRKRSTDVINPFTGKKIASVPVADKPDIEAAVAAAKNAQKSWADLLAGERAEYLNKACEKIADEKEHLAKVIVKEQGKTYKEALGEVDDCIFHLKYAAEWAFRIEGDILPADKRNEKVLIEKIPHGVVLGITPWNYPLAVPARKIGPALITGNTVVLKPHENTPLSAIELARIFQSVSLPRGVLNIITGPGVEIGDDLTGNADVDYITVTGSVKAGKQIYSQASLNVTPVSLELGGKAPFIIMDDVDVDHAVKHALKARVVNCGQVCICNERTYVHEDIYDEFVEKFVKEMSKLNVGDPMDEQTDIGPKANETELIKVTNMVNQAVEEGAEVQIGGAPLNTGSYKEGFWYPPTVLTNINQGMDIIQKETFGPVTPIIKFSDINEAISLANDSDYGLSSYLFTNNYKNIMKSIKEIDFGEIYVNRSGGESFHAYHSGYRNSGVSGDDGKYGVENYMKKKTVYLNY